MLQPNWGAGCGISSATAVASDALYHCESEDIETAYCILLCGFSSLRAKSSPLGRALYDRKRAASGEVTDVPAAAGESVLARSEVQCICCKSHLVTNYVDIPP